MANVDDYLTSPGTPIFEVGDDGEQKWAEQNKGVTPLFFIEPVANPAKTAAEGRPIFDEEERVRIVVAGDQFNQVVHPVTDDLRIRFGDQYRRWKEKRTERHIDGTPLRQWALLTSTQVAEFEALNIFNVEGLSVIADTNLSKAPSLREWRDKAKAWLESAKDGSVAVRLAAENTQLKDEIDSLKREFAELSARVDQQQQAKRAGRPPLPREDAA